MKGCMRCLLIPAMILAAGVALGAVPALSAAPATVVATASTLPAGWVAGLNAEVEGVKPLCMNLWPGAAPNQVASPAKAERDDGTARIWDVNVPGIMVYRTPAEKAAAAGGTCIIACMGGSYTHLTRLVGADNTLPEFLPRGIMVVSLKYRLKTPSADPERDAVLDGQRAIRTVRAHAKEWGIDPHKVGMLGWSAGGNLILSLTTHLKDNGNGDPKAADPIERENCRPDFIALLSPWPNGRQIAAYPAPKNAPPAFIGNAQDDTTAPFAFAKAIQAAWEAAGNKAEFMEIATGGHGAFELTTGTAKDWPERFMPWLEKQGMWKKP